jgi:hypothetical protein
VHQAASFFCRVLRKVHRANFLQIPSDFAAPAESLEENFV